MDGQSPTNGNFVQPSPDSNDSSPPSNFSDDPAKPDSKPNAKFITLESPGGGNPLTFEYAVPNVEFVEILKLALEEFDSLRAVVHKKLASSNVDSLYHADYETLEKLCKSFNRAATTVSSLWKGTTKSGADMASQKLLQRVITHCYNKAVDNEKSLNKHYEAFSSQTYGETSFNRMQMIIDEIKPTAHDVFVDLGSGVGQLVVHMAGGSRVKKAFGIEIARLPAKFAARLEEEFRKLMKFYGKKHRPFCLEMGDFLNSKYTDRITKEATIVFINNYAFTSDLEARIKRELLSELQNGAKIISTKPYAPLNKVSVTDRQLNDISSILDVYELKPCDNPCSWTSAHVPYYLHIVNHGKLEEYFSKKKSGALQTSEPRRSLTPSASSKNSNSRESSVGYRDPRQSPKNASGPTTRQKWNEYVSGSTSRDSVDRPSHKSTSDKKAYFSDDSDPEPDRKRKKQGKSIERANPKKSRSRKRPDESLTPKDEELENATDPAISSDAQQGIELMHKITQAVCVGRSIDAEESAMMLADLNTSSAQLNGTPSGGTKKTKERSNKARKTPIANGTKKLMMLPLPDMIAPTRRNKRSLDSCVSGNSASSKYPYLDVFLSELRRNYENFLDTIQAPAPLLPKPEPVSSPVANMTNSASGASLLSVPSANPNAEQILQMVDRIHQKQSDLSQEITNLRKAIVPFLTAASASQLSPSQAHHNPPILDGSLPIPNGVPPTNVQPMAENPSALEVLQRANMSASITKFSTAAPNNPAMNSVYAQLLETCANLATKPSSNLATQNLNHLNPTALLALQNNINGQQPLLSPRQSSNLYGNQLNGAGLALGNIPVSLNNTTTLINQISAQKNVHQWNTSVAEEFAKIARINDQSQYPNHQLNGQSIIQQGSTFMSLLQQQISAGNTGALAQLQNNFPIAYSTSNIIPSSSMSVPSTSSNAISNSHGPESGAQLFSSALNGAETREPKVKKSERKSKTNHRSSKNGSDPYSAPEQRPTTTTTTSETINDAPSSSTNTHNFDYRVLNGSSMETMLNETLSIDSQLPRPKEPAHQPSQQHSFASPNF